MWKEENEAESLYRRAKTQIKSVGNLALLFKNSHTHTHAAHIPSIDVLMLLVV